MRLLFCALLVVRYSVGTGQANRPQDRASEVRPTPPQRSAKATWLASHGPRQPRNNFSGPLDFEETRESLLRAWEREPEAMLQQFQDLRRTVERLELRLQHCMGRVESPPLPTHGVVEDQATSHVQGGFHAHFVALLVLVVAQCRRRRDAFFFHGRSLTAEESQAHGGLKPTNGTCKHDTKQCFHCSIAPSLGYT